MTQVSVKDRQGSNMPENESHTENLRLADQPRQREKHGQIMQIYNFGRCC